MKRTILIGSLFACFLMLMIPNISAIENLTISNSGPDYDEDELIQAIIERIEELQESNPKVKFDSDLDDPDGPFEGGLDDQYDWIQFFIILVNIYIGVLMLKNHILIEALETRSVFLFLLSLYDYGLWTYAMYIGIGDAFDIIDPNEDGY